MCPHAPQQRLIRWWRSDTNRASVFLCGKGWWIWLSDHGDDARCRRFRRSAPLPLPYPSQIGVELSVVIPRPSQIGVEFSNRKPIGVEFKPSSVFLRGEVSILLILFSKTCHQIHFNLITQCGTLPFVRFNVKRKRTPTAFHSQAGARVYKLAEKVFSSETSIRARLLVRPIRHAANSSCRRLAVAVAKRRQRITCRARDASGTRRNATRPCRPFVENKCCSSYVVDTWMTVPPVFT
jgi:hypothetical protein